MKVDKIKELYLKKGKHAHYQIMPTRVEKVLQIPEEQIRTRFERERLNFISRYVDFKKKKILDIGGNTGFFSFESLDLGAKEATLIEGNPIHVKFVNELARLTHSEVIAMERYLNFHDNFPMDFYDIIFNLNVIHHLGDDFGRPGLSKSEALQKMAETFDYLSVRCSIMVFQMGFCWMGNRRQLLFENGTKQEMIDFIKKCTEDKWLIQATGIAQENNGITTYHELNNNNIHRDDNLGEFRNRPIFILKSYVN